MFMKTIYKSSMFSFTIVRDPFERILSAYRLQENNSFLKINIFLEINFSSIKKQEMIVRNMSLKRQQSLEQNMAP